MTRNFFGLRLIGLCLASAAVAGQAQTLPPAWIELGEGGQALARVVVANADPVVCPAIAVDGANQTMALRQPVPQGFQPVCEFALPSNAKSASINEQVLHLPVGAVASVVVIGDTGCRIKGARAQDCNDMTKWPLQAVADHAAGANPDLIIHVGDYLYRESVCPVDAQAKCGGTPVGDNWETWNADFFGPAAKLLAAAPWAFSRGNHEDCERAWRGWFYYLDPRPWTNTCAAYTPAYVVKLGTRQLVMLDSSAVKEDDADPQQVAHYAADLQSLNVENAWLVDHHPFWGVKSSEKGSAVKSLSAPLEAAWDQVKPKGIDMVLSGHVHLFAVLPFDSGRPLQIISGDGGTMLAEPVPASVDGTVIQGNAVRGSQTRMEFGYTWLQITDNGWRLSLRSTNDATLVQCNIARGQSDCKSPNGQ
jgi:Calcineurin-like phosphoesterase